MLSLPSWLSDTETRTGLLGSEEPAVEQRRWGRGRATADDVSGR